MTDKTKTTTTSKTTAEVKASASTSTKRKAKAKTPLGATKKSVPKKSPAKKTDKPAPEPDKSPKNGEESVSIKGRGRPTLKTEALVNEILDRLYEGEPLAKICRDDHMPNRSTVYDWQESDEQFSRHFARAREDGFEMLAVETLLIADDSEDDYIEAENMATGATYIKFNKEHVSRARLRIDTRLKLLSKWSPHKYGDKLDMNVGTQANDPIRTLMDALSGQTLKPIEG